jgi:hypothetical protein
MKRSYISIALYLFLVFASGIVVGVFGYRLYSGTPVSAKVSQKLTPDEWRRQYFEEMQDRVHLSQDQMQKLNTIFDETKSNQRQAHESCDTALKQIKDEHISKVRSMLSDEQRPQYDELRAEREQRAKLAGR